VTKMSYLIATVPVTGSKANAAAPITWAGTMSVAEQLQRLEADVTHLKTWAGPGQVEALLDGQRELREDMGKVKAKLDRHERILGTLKKDMGGLKAEFAEFTADMSDFKAEMLELQG